MVRRGAFYYYGSRNLAQGRAKTIEVLKGDAGLRGQVEEEVRAKMRGVVSAGEGMGVCVMRGVGWGVLRGVVSAGERSGVGCVMRGVVSAGESGGVAWMARMPLWYPRLLDRLCPCHFSIIDCSIDCLSQ